MAHEEHSMERGNTGSDCIGKDCQFYWLCADVCLENIEDGDIQDALVNYYAAGEEVHSLYKSVIKLESALQQANMALSDAMADKKSHAVELQKLGYEC